MENGIIIGFIVTLSMMLFFTYGWFFYLFINNLKLIRYLKKNNYKRWRYLTMIGNLGPGMSNPVRGFKYLYSSQDNEDEKILRWKDTIRIACRYFLCGVAGIAVTIIVIIIWVS